MKKSLTLITVLLVMLNACGGKNDSAAVAASPELAGAKQFKSGVISLYAKEKGGKLWLQFTASEDHAIQISGYNKLELSDGKTTRDLTLTGNPRSDKPDYYAAVNPIEVALPAKAPVLKGRLLFCNLVQNFCSQQKLNLTISL